MQMDEPSTYLALITIGALLAASLAANRLGERTPRPRVSLLLSVGVLAGPLVLDVLPTQRDQWFPVAARIALVMVGFLIGGEFTRERLRRHGSTVALMTAGQGLVFLCAGITWWLDVSYLVAAMVMGVPSSPIWRRTTSGRSGRWRGSSGRS